MLQVNFFFCFQVSSELVLAAYETMSTISQSMATTCTRESIQAASEETKFDCHWDELIDRLAWAVEEGARKVLEAGKLARSRRAIFEYNKVRQSWMIC